LTVRPLLLLIFDGDALGLGAGVTATVPSSTFTGATWMRALGSILSIFLGAGDLDLPFWLAFFGGRPGPRFVCCGSGDVDDDDEGARFLTLNFVAETFGSIRGFFLGLPRFLGATTGVSSSEDDSGSGEGEGDSGVLIFGGLPRFFAGGSAGGSGRMCFLGLPGPRFTGGDSVGFNLGLPGPRLTGASTDAGNLDFTFVADAFTLGVPLLGTAFGETDFRIEVRDLLSDLATRSARFCAATQVGQNQLDEVGTDLRGGSRHDR